MFNSKQTLSSTQSMSNLKMQTPSTKINQSTAASSNSKSKGMTKLNAKKMAQKYMNAHKKELSKEKIKSKDSEDLLTLLLESTKVHRKKEVFEMKEVLKKPPINLPAPLILE